MVGMVEDKINEIKSYAKENNVPIMMDDGIDFLTHYIKENNVYTYIFYMPFANFYLMDYINFLSNDNLTLDAKVKVVCLDCCVNYVRKYLDEKVEVTCISID